MRSLFIPIWHKNIPYLIFRDHLWGPPNGMCGALLDMLIPFIMCSVYIHSHHCQLKIHDVCWFLLCHKTPPEKKEDKRKAPQILEWWTWLFFNWYVLVIVWVVKTIKLYSRGAFLNYSISASRTRITYLLLCYKSFQIEIFFRNGIFSCIY